MRIPIIGEYIEAKRAQWALAAHEARLGAMQVESLMEATREYDLFRDQSARWMRDLSKPERELSSMALKELQIEAMRLWRESPLIRNGIRKLGFYVLGRGVTYDCENEAALQRFESWSKRNKFDDIEDEIFRRLLRDGEFFIEWFGSLQSLRMRFIDVENIVEPVETPNVGESWTYGIATPVDDVANVLGYFVKRHANDNRLEFVSAENITHVKLDADMNMKRGEPLIVSVSKAVNRLNEKREFQHILMRMRLAIAFVQKVPNAAPSQLRGLAQKTGTPQSTTNDEAIKTFKPGTVLTTNNAEYDFKSPQLDAGDVIALFRDDELCVAQGMGIPEHILSENAQNANYASTLAAESPFVQSVYWYRDTLTAPFKEIFIRVTGEEEVSISYPNIESRSYGEDAKAVIGLNAARILSRQTGQERLGHDPELEAERLAEEADEQERQDEIEFQRERELMMARGGSMAAEDSGERSGPMPMMERGAA